MYWLLIGDYNVDVVEAEDFYDLHGQTDSDYYHTIIKLDDTKLRAVKDGIEKVLPKDCK